jgi:hypothetical protein
MVEQRRAADQLRFTIDLSRAFDSYLDMNLQRFVVVRRISRSVIRVRRRVETERGEVRKRKKTLTFKKIVCYIFHS